MIKKVKRVERKKRTSVGNIYGEQRKKSLRHTSSHRKHLFKPERPVIAEDPREPAPVAVKAEIEMKPVVHGQYKKSGNPKSNRVTIPLTKWPAKVKRTPGMSKETFQKLCEQRREAVLNAVSVEEPVPPSRRKTYTQRKAEKIEAQKRNYQAKMSIFARAQSKTD